MTDAFRKVKSGDPLNIPATAYNAMLDAAVANMRLNNKPSAIRGDSQGVYVMVSNETGYPLEQFEVLGIDGPMFDPRSQREAFQQTPVLRGVVPEKEHQGKFVVLQEPAAPYAVVRACLSGLTVARLRVKESEEEESFSEPKSCDIEEGETYFLSDNTRGGASILWIESGSGDKWALIRIGHGDTSVLFPVVMENVTGGAGDHESQCDFKYDVFEFPKSGEALEKYVDPTSGDYYKRPEFVKMKEATFGIAFWDENNELKIAWCNEVMETKSCSSENDDKEDT